MSNKTFLYGLIFLKLLLPYLLQHSMYEPHRDEFLYLAEGNHLDWGFMEVPPLLSVFAWLTHVLGGGMFWIKLWPSMFGAATLFIMGWLVLLLGGKKFALFLLFLTFIMTGYLRVFFLFQPNAPEVFFWSLLVFAIIRYVQTGANRWLYLFGVAAGLGMLSKYSVLFYIVSLVGGLLLSPYRNVFLNKHFWLASLLGFVIFLPNLWWQYVHHFPVVYHMNQLHETQLQYVSTTAFLVSQVVMFLPCLFIWLSGWYSVSAGGQTRYRFVGIAYLFVILLLIAGHGKGYYALGAYPVLFAFGATALEKSTAVKRQSFRYLFTSVPLVIGLIFLPVALPLFAPPTLAAIYARTGIANTGQLRWEDLQNHPLPQDFSDMLGWKEMAEKVGKAYHSLSEEEQRNTLIFANNYGMAGAVNYYRHQYHLPEVYSDNASFLYWLPDSVHFSNLILITTNQEELKEKYVQYFQSAYIADSITHPYAREHGDLIVVEKGADKRFEQFFKDKLRQDKAESMPY